MASRKHHRRGAPITGLLRQSRHSPGGTVSLQVPSIRSRRATTLSDDAPPVQKKNGSGDRGRELETSTTASSPEILAPAIVERGELLSLVLVMRRRKSSLVSRACVRGASSGHASSGLPSSIATSHARVTPSGEVGSLVTPGRSAGDRIMTIATTTSARTATPIHPVNRSMPLLSAGGTLPSDLHGPW